ncbi:16S rRNA (uracil1498-N3)-methyltransferase [Bacillus ectoiniformans]|uniref:16S rRNA (uracil(1498)-N(3))-methyltransferase n=1 Tax=Bacillus ectoiniformans TaxID=1494429 RepID=UPI00195EA32E|nr:16S rRNA (uracil(1498)-N(3))-methyltransferase [Bacillus ectoiniformans]MBM7649987.1 16S rRNA (uracil1498-N3)-methyltransferase [Bacillus ectoiniformans]
MQRYFINERPADERTVTIAGEDFHHLSRVMRMQAGDRLFVVFPSKEAAIAEVEEISKDYAQAFIVEWVTDDKELPVKVAIASGLPKGDKLEYVIQKGTELGAGCFIPFHADRSVVKLDAKKAEKKTERWSKIAKEAAEQSHRNLIPEVYQPMNFDQLIQLGTEYSYKIFAYEEEAKQGETAAFHKVLKSMKPDDDLIVVFGPEGGISDKEVKKLTDNGFIPCGLGPRILRTETAPLYVLSAVSYQFELMR